MSAQEMKFKEIADAIREKDGTTAPIVANDFAARIRALEEKVNFAVPLVIAADEGALITAVHSSGEQTVIGTTDADRRATLILNHPGDWRVTAQLGDVIRGPDKLEVLSQYDMVFSFAASRLPEGYTEVEYISNPNLAIISPLLNIVRPFDNTRIEMRAEIVDKSKDGIIFGNYYRYRYANTYRGNANAIKYYQSDNMLNLEFGYSSNFYLPKYRYYIPTPNGKIDIVVDLPKFIYQVNDIKVDIPSTATTSSQYLGTLYPCLFGGYESYYWKLSANGSASSHSMPVSPCNCKIYSFKMYTSTADSTGDLIMNLVPCTNPEGIAGLYDLVSDTFFANTTHTSYAGRLFEAGPVI